MHKNEKGFTLVELMVVVVIIGILVAIAIPIYNNVTINASRSAIEANLRTIDGAVMMFYTSGRVNAAGAVQADLTSDAAGVTSLVTHGYLVSNPVGPGTLVVADYALTGTAPAQRSTVTLTLNQFGTHALGTYNLTTLPW